MSNLHASGEEYLKWILRLQKTGGLIRSIDLAQEMGYSRPSVSIALKKLENNGFLTKDENGYLQLTENGLKVAENMSERHRFLTDFLVMLGVSENTAISDACKIEHDLSEESFERIKESTKLYISR